MWKPNSASVKAANSLTLKHTVFKTTKISYRDDLFVFLTPFEKFAAKPKSRLHALNVPTYGRICLLVILWGKLILELLLTTQKNQGVSTCWGPNPFPAC